jgi:hypothetical protein
VREIEGFRLLSRQLPSGRIINVDLGDWDDASQHERAVSGGKGIAHLDMDNGNNIDSNIRYVTEAEGRRLLMGFTEDG